MDLLAWLTSLPPDERDAAIDDRLGAASSDAPGEHFVGYHASGVAPIMRALIEAPVTSEDVVIDLGAGLGKVLMFAELTGAKARGIEIQRELAARARATALDVTVGDVCDADLRDGTVFFLYNPFTEPVVGRVLSRLEEVARDHAIVVCALGIELRAPWLIPRELDAFWLSIYDSNIANVPARRPSESPIAWARALAFEE